MADENAQPSGDWEWMLEESGLRLSCVLIFARDVTQDQMFESFDLDPSSARMEEWVFDPDRPRVRVGQVGMVTEANDTAEGPEDDLSAALDLATLALGIRLPREIAMGPLATVTLAANRWQP